MNSRKNSKNNITRRTVINKMICIAAALTFALLLCFGLNTGAEEQTVQVGIPVEEHSELFITRSMPTHGEGRIAVFLIDFPDYRNNNPVATREYYDKLYFSGGVETNWGETTVAEFYREQSYGKLNLSGYVFDWYTAKHERSYYDYRKAELVMEAAEYYRAQGADFSQFDGDGDGVIDAITYHFAGDYSIDRNSPWYLGLKYDHGGTIGDMKFTTMVQLNEGAQAGWCKMIESICHELMHTLGMPDLYSEVELEIDIVQDLMSKNKRMINPYTKILLGWIDTVKVITRDTNNIRLDVYGDKSPGSVAIVTDSFNGLFDEFYLVAYRQYGEYTYAVIWHIDARLNESGSGFAYQNLCYDPSPGDGHSHGAGYYSEHLFIEEISADPDVDFILNPPVWFDETDFDENSVLGPGGIPSSDTHDGKFTGIKIDNFIEHNEEYLTFDVSFVEDNSAPVVTTSEKELELKETVTLEFNEHIYAGDNFDNIKVTDQKGALLDATVTLAHYPRNEIEITFKTDAYSDGYIIVMPKGAVKDSSGNEMAEITLSASEERYFFPTSDKRLPNTGANIRNNAEADFFSDKDSLVVITRLWGKRNGEYVLDTNIEFMRLDLSGNVLIQTIVDNPFEKSSIRYVFKTGDGSYIFVCSETLESRNYDLLFCIDRNGNLKWTNREYCGSGVSFNYGYFKRNGDLVMKIAENKSSQLLCINSETGKIYNCTSEYGDSDFYENQFFDLGNERIMVQKAQSSTESMRWELVDAITGDVIAHTEIKCSWDYDYHIQQIHDNGDGTIILTCYMGQSVGAVLLDSELNLIKRVQLRRIESDGNKIVWLEDDGFCDIDRTAIGNHDNNQFHIRRYDRHLNLAWESDVIANFIYYFKASSGDIMAYRSMFTPRRECYIDYYGSEEELRVPHTHNLIHTEEVPATCQTEGMAEYWYCTDCGRYYAGNSENAVVDLKTLILPKGDHKAQEIPAQEGGCGWSGTTAGAQCSVCKKILIYPETVPATGEHSYGEWNIVRNPNCKMTGIEQRMCSGCSGTDQREIPILDEHTFGDWNIFKEPTVESEGEEKRVCGVCGKNEVRLIEKLAPPEGSETPEIPEAKPKDLWWIALIVVGIGTVIILSFVLINKSKKAKQ